MKKLRVLVVDDHPLLREGTRLAIDADPDCEVCATAGSGREAVAQAAGHRPDVVVLDFHLPDADGLSVARDIRRENPEIEIVIYSAEARDEVIAELLENGVKSFVSKAEPSETLLAAIKAVGEHRPYITHAVSEILLRRAMAQPEENDLTPRETQVVRLVAAGRANKEIALELGISARTAESHRASLMRKLRLFSTADVVRYAIRHGIIEA